MSKYWIVVAAAEHIRRGLAGGFVQACHGKVAPLKRAGQDGILKSPQTGCRFVRMPALSGCGVVSIIH